MPWRAPPGYYRMRRLVLLRDRYRCWICGHDAPRADSADHVVPQSQGGGWTMDNLRAAHLLCNQRKGDRQVLPEARVDARWTKSGAE